MKQYVEQVFVREGVPQFTFVEPPNFNSILVDIRRAGKPVIIEGQSGAGKTTCVKKILEKLNGVEVSYLTARNATHVSRIDQLAKSPSTGIFVIDDFHRLAKSVQDKLANLAKAAAEQDEYNPDLPKLIIIGINDIGSALIQLVPDLAKRIGIHKIQGGGVTHVGSLVDQGCSILNISIKNKSEIFDETRLRTY